MADAQFTSWHEATAANDFAVHIKLSKLAPAVRYYLTVEARASADSPVSASVSGSFATPAPADQWQDVRCGVITCQSYWHLDHREGFNIYPAMQRLNFDFIVATGDNVYLDSDAPRGRTVELARHHWQRMYSLPRIVDFHRRTPGYWEVDDHDALANDCWPEKKVPWMTPLTYAGGARVFREQNPIEDPTYRTIRWGQGLQIWLVEARQYRSPNTAPDGPRKTIWGKEQREWLKRTLLESDATFKLLISPTPIVGPDRDNKFDNHANKAFAYEGEGFRQWTKEHKLDNLFVVCGDRHWQYLSIDPATGLREFACGPASDEHATGSPGQVREYQPFHREKGGFLSVTVTRDEGKKPVIYFRHHDVHGEVVHEFKSP
jgi:alkaline phosphatase D